MPVTIDGSNTPTAGGVGYGDGTELAFTSAGSAGQVLLSNGASAPSFGAVPTVNLATGVTGTLPVANGGTGASSLTANNVLLGNGTSAVQVVAPGTNGNVLTSNGTTWTSAAAPGGGALIFLSSQTVSGTPSTVDFTSGIDSTYDNYMVILSGVKLSTTALLYMRLRKSGSFQTATYRWQRFEIYNGNASSATTYMAGSSSGSEIRLNGGNCDSNTIQSGTILITNVNSASGDACTVMYDGLGTGPGSTQYHFRGMSGGSQGTAAAVTGIRFLLDTGTFTQGTFVLYGIKQS